MTIEEIDTQLVCAEQESNPGETDMTEKKIEEPHKEVIDDAKVGLRSADTFTSPILFEQCRETPIDASDGKAKASEKTIRKIKVSAATPALNKKLQEGSWVERALHDEFRDQQKPLTIGLTLISKRNVILAMRDALSRLVLDFSRNPNSKRDPNSISCSALVEVLGAFSHRDVEISALRCILEPYLRVASSPWLERPLTDQKAAFERLALQQLTECIPPTPLALMFIAALLEQKIVLSSSRRSILLSACVALATMMRPLQWSHLLVPLVPSNLANDLIQYPAPFILGIPAEDAGNLHLLGNLPNDVTLVDLDVGRVILAPSFGRDNEMVRGTANADVTAKALRSQVLYLAQSLGSVFGNRLRKDTWCCDSPFNNSNQQCGIAIQQADGLDELLSSTRSFLSELLHGVTSCCFWIEEATQGFGTSDEPTVLFDEDRFFHIKKARASGEFKPLFIQNTTADLALSLDDFDLIIESFLRCQSMSHYISSRPKEEMVYY